MAEEQLLEDEPINGDDDVIEDAVTYSIIDNSSQRGKSKLLDNKGYSYTLRVRKPHVTYWRCAIRNRAVVCGASVIQRGNDFTPGPVKHTHEAKPNCDSVTRMIAYIKSKAFDDFSRPATSIVREVYKETFGNNISTPVPGMPTESSLARRASRFRNKMMSEGPKDLDELCEGFLDADGAPSMVYKYRVNHDKLSKKGHRKRKKKKSKRSRAKKNSSVVVENVSSQSHNQSSVQGMLSGVSKATTLNEIAALIAERDAALKRVEEIEHELFTKYQIPVVDCT